MSSEQITQDNGFPVHVRQPEQFFVNDFTDFLSGSRIGRVIVSHVGDLREFCVGQPELLLTSLKCHMVSGMSSEDQERGLKRILPTKVNTKPATKGN